MLLVFNKVISPIICNLTHKGVQVSVDLTKRNRGGIVGTCIGAMLCGRAGVYAPCGYLLPPPKIFQFNRTPWRRENEKFVSYGQASTADLNAYRILLCFRREQAPALRTQKTSLHLLFILMRLRRLCSCLSPKAHRYALLYSFGPRAHLRFGRL